MKEKWAVGSVQCAARNGRLYPTGITILLLLLTAHCTLLTVSCRRDMQDQPKMKPYRSSTFFSDGL